MSIIFLDIDLFKNINDTLGYIMGDLILKVIAYTIKETLDVGMSAFRYGGDEFAVILENNDVNFAFSFAERIRLAVENYNLFAEVSKYIKITISAGIASYPEDSLDIDEVVKSSKIAMKYSKNNGRNQCTRYTHYLENITKKETDYIINENTLFQSVKSMAFALEARDSYTGKHSTSVKNYSMLIAEAMDMDEENKKLLKIASILHDCGKIGIPDSLLNKKEKLTLEEYNILKKHSDIGYYIVSNFIENNMVKNAIKSHHERWDGKGYPDGLAGNNIPLFSRIIGVADAYHAMISDRPYRKGLTLEESLHELEKGKGEQFDPKIASIFIEEIKKFEASNVKEIKYVNSEDTDYTVFKEISGGKQYSNELLRKGYDDKTIYILLIDRSCRIIYSNLKINEFISKSEDEIRAKKCYEVIMGRNFLCNSCKIKEVIKEKKIQSSIKEEVTLKGDQQVLHQVWVPIFDSDGEVEAILEIAIPL